MNILVQGFLLGLAYASPIGVQNIFVLTHTFKKGLITAISIASIVAAMDISLALVCIFGIGTLLQDFKVLQIIINIGGALYLLFISYQLFKQVIKSDTIELSDANNVKWSDIIFKSFLLTWLNPHAIIDGTTILGGYSVSFNSYSRGIFIIGVALASLCWFISISIMSTILSSTKNSYKYFNYLKIFSATLIAVFAVKMFFNLKELI
ncbi:MAG: LysE/ArgO family amino acid transporter [Pseudobdellovibrionaceae bacterium]